MVAAQGIDGVLDKGEKAALFNELGVRELPDLNSPVYIEGAWIFGNRFTLYNGIKKQPIPEMNIRAYLENHGLDF